MATASRSTIQQQSEDVLKVEEGSLYPALQRMLIKGVGAEPWVKPIGKQSPRALLPPDCGRQEAIDRRSQREFERVMAAITGRVIEPA